MAFFFFQPSARSSPVFPPLSPATYFTTNPPRRILEINFLDVLGLQVDIPDHPAHPYFPAHRPTRPSDPARRYFPLFAPSSGYACAQPLDLADFSHTHNSAFLKPLNQHLQDQVVFPAGSVSDPATHPPLALDPVYHFHRADFALRGSLRQLGVGSCLLDEDFV